MIIAPKKFTDHFALFKANHREIVKAEIVLDKENFSFSFLTKLQFVIQLTLISTSGSSTSILLSKMKLKDSGAFKARSFCILLMALSR